MSRVKVGSWDVAFGRSRVVFRPGGLADLGTLTAELGAKRVLLVTDVGMRRAGYVDRAVTALEASSIDVRVFDAVIENPTTETVEAGAEMARAHAVDALIGFGGGSPMDCAKGINFLLTNGGRMEDYWGWGKASKPMLPSIGVPTTAGTGSEAQSYALISQKGTGAKMACGAPGAMFRQVLLDPTLLATVPRSIVASTGIDAISHAVESYVSRKRNPISTLYAGEAWRLLDGAFEPVLSGTADEVVLGDMLLGSFLAGAAIEHSMLGAAHACANPLTARFGVTHGHAVGLMLPHVMRFNATQVASQYAELEAGTNGKPHGPLVDRICALRSTAGLPQRLRDCSVPSEALPQLATDAARQWTAGFNPVQVTSVELEKLYEAAY